MCWWRTWDLQPRVLSGRIRQRRLTVRKGNPDIRDAAVKINPEVMVICHGGPISEPEDAEYILKNTEGIVGFFGASSVERLPTEIAITGQVKKFQGD